MAKDKNPRRVAAGKRLAARMRREGRGIFGSRRQAQNPTKRPAMTPTRTRYRKVRPNPTEAGFLADATGMGGKEMLAGVLGSTAAVGVAATLTQPKPGEPIPHSAVRALAIAASGFGIGKIVEMAMRQDGDKAPCRYAQAITAGSALLAGASLVLDAASRAESQGKLPLKVKFGWSTPASPPDTRLRGLGNVQPQAGTPYGIPFQSHPQAGYPYGPALGNVYPQAGIAYDVPVVSYAPEAPSCLAGKPGSLSVGASGGLSGSRLESQFGG